MHTVVLLKNDSVGEYLEIGGSIAPPTVICWSVCTDVLNKTSSGGRTIGHVKF